MTTEIDPRGLKLVWMTYWPVCVMAASMIPTWATGLLVHHGLTMVSHDAIANTLITIILGIFSWAFIWSRLAVKIICILRHA